MLAIQYGFCKLFFTDDFIVLRNDEFTTATILGSIRKNDINIDDYIPELDDYASSFFAIPMYIASALEDRRVYKWELYNEINSFQHKTAFELYELISDYLEYCNRVEERNFKYPDRTIFFYRPGFASSLKFIIDILEVRNPSLKMEYKLRKW